MFRRAVVSFALSVAMFLAAGCGTGPEPERKLASKQTTAPVGSVASGPVREVTIHVPEMKQRLNLD